MRSPAQIDVLIPVFNAGSTVAAAVASIQAQTVQDIRLIIVDDGSTDRSAAILARIAAADPRVHLVHQPNSGIVDALNAGLSLCTAPLVARHDADDLAAPDRFARQLEYLNAYPGCIAVDGYYWIIDAQGRRTGAQAFAYGPISFDAAACPSTEPYLTHPFLMARRESLVSAGGYRHAFHSEDTDLYWRLLRFGELRHMPLFVGEYRFHGGSISSRSIINGRIAAISSQLAAISHRRREARRPDIDFPRGNLARFIQAATLEAMLAIADEQLDREEGRWLRIAASAKLLELATYRPYLPDMADVTFVMETLSSADVLHSPGGAALIRGNRALVAAKLVRHGHWRAGLRLSPGHGPVMRSAARQAALTLRARYGRWLTPRQASA